MPPIRNKSQKNSAEQEGRILLAISDLKNGIIHSVRQAAEIYTVSRQLFKIGSTTWYIETKNAPMAIN